MNDPQYSFMTAEVRDVMNPSVRFCHDTDSIGRAGEMLSSFRISGMPVVNDFGHLVGVISVADFAEHFTALSAGCEPSRQKHAVCELMTSPAFSVSPQATLADAAQLMSDRGVHRLPVVDDTGRLIGILSSLDIVSAMAHVTAMADALPVG